MEQHEDLPMDFADATLVTSAEALKARCIFTLDFADFALCRAKLGRRPYALELLGRERLE